MNTCNTCEHFYKLDNGNTFCRAHPPTVTIILAVQRHPITGQTQQTPVPMSSFPPVGADEVCGEWTQGGPRVLLS